MRIVLDTNVLVAAFVSRGFCFELLEHCAREHELLSSRSLLNELDRALRSGLGITAEEVEAAVALIAGRVALIDPEPLEEPVCRDPDDDQVLAVGLSGRAHCIVTGDQDLLVPGEFRGIPILRPSGFWEFEAGG